ncbi:MAG: BamA/TamA family outer membrane protein [Rhodothermales bacterium]
MRSTGAVIRVLLVVLVAWLCAPAPGTAQYFRYGKNKVQYAELTWSYLQSRHFDIYYYEGGRDLADYTAHFAEEAYEHARRLLQIEINGRIPIIVYQSHNDFVVTNAVDLPTFSEGIAGVTEPYKNRIAIPFVGDYRQYRQTLHHELVHAMLNDFFYGGSLQSIIQNNIRLQIPHWFNEGLAEYASEGWSSDADDWMRDAVVHDDIPPMKYIGGFASYQAGQGVWDYIGEQYGRERIAEVLQRLRLSQSVEASFKRATGLSLDELSERWHRALKQVYFPELAAREDVNDFARAIITTANGGFYNTSPSLSPQGDRLAFITTRNGLFDVYIADANEGTIEQKLVDGQTSAEFESLRILTPGISWSPDGRHIALAVKSGPTDAIAVIDVDTHDVIHYRVPGVDQIISVAWSPTEQQIAFEASVDAQSDIFVLDLDTHETINYTDDLFSDHEPAWSPDGRSLVFHSDRGSYTRLGQFEAGAFAMQEHDFGQYDVYLLPLGADEAERLTFNELWDDRSAKFGEDSTRVLFISDRNGIFNLYEKNLVSGLVRPLTNALNGITQVSLSADGGTAALMSLESGRPQLYVLKNPFDRVLPEANLTPNVWAQRVVQETLTPAPAIALAPDGLRLANPFLRDATDGTAFTRATSRTDDFLASRLLMLARDDADAQNDSPFSVDAEWDSSRYGNVRVDLRDYIFSANAEDQQAEELDYLINPFTPHGNVDVDGRYKPRKYKLRFSPDLVYGAAGYDALFGVQGITQIIFSDMLGNHRVLVASNLLVDLRNSDYMMSYVYLPKRVDWGGSGFHVSRLLPDFARRTIYRYRQYGVSLTASYPFDKFRRVDVDLSVVGVSQSDIVEPSAPALTRALLHPSVIFTRDVTTPGPLAPLEGSRFSVSLAGSPFGLSGETVRFVTLLGDARTYASIGQSLYTLAFRFSGGTSIGPTQQLFYTAGLQNWINRRFDENNGFPIEDISDFVLATPIMPLRGYRINALNGTNFGLVNAEFRFPLIAAILPGPLPLLPLYNIQGAAFLDAGAVWGGRGFDNPFDLYTVDAQGKRIFDDFALSTGVGLRTIFLGYPLRFDFAWPYDGRRFKRQSLNFSIGFDF